MNLLFLVTQWLVLLLGIVGVIGCIAFVSMWALDVTTTALGVHRYLVQFIWDEELRKKAKENANREGGDW